MKLDKLIRMANQIAANLDYGGDPAEVVKGTADHLKRFWEPRMLDEIVAYLREDGAELSPSARSAIERIAAQRQQPA